MKKSRPQKGGKNRYSRMFLSFSRQDGHLPPLLYRLLDELTGHSGVIFKTDEVHAPGIRAGEDWRHRILKELRQAPALVGLITRNSLNGRWIWLESGIVWSRKNGSLVLLATPELRPEDLSPFDHLQIVFLKKDQIDQVKAALNLISEKVGKKVRWTKKASGLLQNLLQAVEEANKAKAASSLSGETTQDRDRGTLLDLLDNLPTPVFDYFVEKLNYSTVIGDIFFYWEGFNAIVSSGAFHIFDLELQDKIFKLHDAWNTALSFGDHCVSTANGRDYIFAPSYKVSEEVPRRFSDATRALETAYKDFLAYVKRHFPDIDLKTTSKKAIVLRNEWEADFDRRIGLRTKSKRWKPAD